MRGSVFFLVFALAGPVSAEALPPARSSNAAKHFGDLHVWWSNVGGGAGFFGKRSTAYYTGFVGMGTFLSEGFELILEMSGWYFDQDVENSVAVGFTPMAQWHFVMEERWSLFASGGVGVLGATERVPDTGTSLNFTPRIDFGITWQFSKYLPRFLAALRWQHISNARLGGGDRNPGRDALFIYAGFTFPPG